MKILDAGTEQLSNTDVLNWVKQKQTQYAQEEGEIQDPKLRARNGRPKNFLSALERHSRVLEAQVYPYTKNPSVYKRSADRYGPMKELDNQVCEQIVFPVEEKYKDWKAQGMKKREMEKKLQEEQEAKSLTSSELLMLINHAPASVSLMEPMIENAEERFTPEEKEILFSIVQKVLRADESNTNAGTG